VESSTLWGQVVFFDALGETLGSYPAMQGEELLERPGDAQFSQSIRIGTAWKPSTKAAPVKAGAAHLLSQRLVCAYPVIAAQAYPLIAA
jgi:hypothetical protein